MACAAAKARGCPTVGQNGITLGKLNVISDQDLSYLRDVILFTPEGDSNGRLSSLVPQIVPLVDRSKTFRRIRWPFCPQIWLLQRQKCMNHDIQMSCG